MNFKKSFSKVLVFSLVAGMLFSSAPGYAAPGDPGKIEAESYANMSGIQTETSSEGGLNVSYVDAGDWLDYTVNVQTAGTYNAEFRVSSPYAGTQLQLVKGTAVLGTVTVPNTGGWQNWQTVPVSVNLSAGSQTLRVYALTNGWNLNWLSLTSTANTEQAAVPTFSPAAGTYTSAQNVTLASATAGAVIKYTTNGSTPTAASPTYTGAINVSATTTIKAIAIKAGLTDSAVATAAYTISSNPQPGNWNLVWNDEFNGAAGTGVDTTKWTYETGGGGFGNNEQEYYTDRTANVYLEQDPADANNRLLVLKAVKENYENRSYTSGRIKTQDKYSFTYGRVEMKAKLPQGQGIWPAFWMLGDDINTAGWPNCGEVDIMEFVGKTPTNVYGTIHGPGYSGGTGIGASFTYPAGFTNDFHTYAIEWEPNVIRWYFDGQLIQVRTVEDLSGKEWVFNHNHFLLLNLAVGGEWPGNPDASTIFPQKYLVDYVRVYQRPGGVYPAPVTRNITSIQAVNGQYVSADNYNNGLLTPNRAAASTWEKFEVVDAGGGKIALRALMNYKYVSAGAGGNSPFNANKETIGPSETFQKIINSDGTVSLKCDANGKYVSASGADPLTASAAIIGANEKFQFSN